MIQIDRFNCFNCFDVATLEFERHPHLHNFVQSRRS